MESTLIEIIPVLPSANIERDISWYRDQVGFELVSSDEIYAILRGINCLFICSGTQILPTTPYWEVLLSGFLPRI